MALYLRQSTASQEVPLGYFVDSADGNTEETALTINNTDIKIWKTGATTLANKNSGGGTHISNGIYYAVLDATDTDTIGPLVIFIHVSGALAVRVECCVLDEAVYDVQFGTTAPATATNITAAAGITLSDDAITAAKIAADAGTELATAVWANATRTLSALDEDSTTLDLDATIRSAVGLASANLDTQLDALPTAAENAAAALTTAMTEAYGTLGGTRTVAQILYELRALLAENSVSSTTVTTKKLDGSTTAHTYTLNSSSAPTAITSAS